MREPKIESKFSWLILVDRKLGEREGVGDPEILHTSCCLCLSWSTGNRAVPAGTCFPRSCHGDYRRSELSFVSTVGIKKGEGGRGLSPILPNVVKFGTDEEHGVVGRETEEDLVAPAIKRLVVGAVDLEGWVLIRINEDKIG